MKLIISIFFYAVILINVYGQNKPLTYYLPDIQYNLEIPAPMDVLGFQIGDWHVSHDQLYYYMKTLAEKSDRVILKEYARSHENRPLIVLIISSPNNIKNIKQIQKDHFDLTNPEVSPSIDITNMPIIVYQGYSVHGNEASGANASLLNAYYLAAGESEEVTEKLNNTVILLDPSFNPDGVQRFSSWVNMHKNKNLTSDPNDREFSESWPGGRTNHYWFDLNRDWISVTHPESYGRIQLFHQWKPEILTDHHEMGTNSTFFFQPGIPERTNPNTPLKNQIFTEEIAKFHVEALDDIKSLYYSKSNYDDYFYGKGSAYPDINGGVGILFEQASSRGHLQESDNGELTFPFTIRNQVKASLSTQKAAINLRMELLEYKRLFFKDAMEEAKNDNTKAYIFKDNDISKLDRFLEILRLHDIKSYGLKESVTINKTEYDSENSYLVPLEQYQSKFIKTLFETESNFRDSIFYDVSTWTMPLAFDLEYSQVSKSLFPGLTPGPEITTSIVESGEVINTNNTYAYIFNWEDYHSATVLYKIMDKGLRTKVLTQPLIIQSGKNVKSFDRGSIVIPIQNQPIDSKEITELLNKLCKEYPIDFQGLASGYGENNISIGHPSVEALEKPEIMIAVRGGARSYNAGEIWHHIDTKLKIPVTKMESDNISARSIKRYNTIILPSGNYSFSERQQDAINDWVSAGGNLILIDRSVDWAVQAKMIYLKKKSSDAIPISESNYESAGNDQGAQVLGGAIFEAKGDLTHPLLYGYADNIFPVFRRSATFYESPENIYASPLKYSATPRMSGYTPRGAEETAAGSVALSVHSKGSGRIVAIMDNPVFRGYWWGGNRILNNAIFFSDLIGSGTTAR
jgi:hypothetical protein